MLILLGIFVTLAIFLFPRVLALRDRNPAQLGWMSERWLMEYRASHLT